MGRQDQKWVIIQGGKWGGDTGSLIVGSLNARSEYQEKLDKDHGTAKS